MDLIGRVGHVEHDEHLGLVDLMRRVGHVGHVEILDVLEFVGPLEGIDRIELVESSGPGRSPAIAANRPCAAPSTSAEIAAKTPQNGVSGGA